MYTIQKQFHFSASHILSGLPEGHQCGRLHRHNYMVEIVLAAKTLNDVGFVVDYGDLKPFKQIIDDELDHRHLNDVLPGLTTAEAIAEYLYHRAKSFWPEVTAIRVSETPRTWAEYRPQA